MKKSLFIILIIIVISSCCKDKPLIPSLTHVPLEIGNSWVYKNYTIDSSGVQTILDRIDSMVITKDTIIGDNKYFVMEGTDYPAKSNWGILNILRDSLGYLVNENGAIIFAQYITSKTFNQFEKIYGKDTIFTKYDKMERYGNSVNVPAGSFDDVLNLKTYITLYKNNDENFKYFDNHLYAKGVGNILKTVRFLHEAQIKRFEKRLLRYHLIEK